MSIWRVIGNILNLFKEEEEYQAFVETERGVDMTVTVKATSTEEAIEKIKENSDEWKILEIRKCD